MCNTSNDKLIDKNKFNPNSLRYYFGFQVLFLGCGDLMNTLQSTLYEHTRNLHIHLNDKNHSVLARNLLMLTVISHGFTPEKEEDLAFLWDVWYNLEWPETTLKRFQEVLKNLLNGELPQNVLIPNSSHLESLKKVWTLWSVVASKRPCQSKSLMENVRSERYSIENLKLVLINNKLLTFFFSLGCGT